MKLINTLITLISLAFLAAIPLFTLEFLLVLAHEWVLKGIISFKDFHHIAWIHPLIPILICICVVLYAFLIVRHYLLIPLRKKAVDVHHQDPDSESHW